MENKIVIKEIVKISGKKAVIVTDPNPFHPAGGGQPGDTGILKSADFYADVTDCQTENGKNFLYIKVNKGELVEELVVEAEVNLERQWLLSRMHSGEHVLSKILENSHPGLHIYKVAVETDSTTVYLHYPNELTWEILFHAEEEGNKVIEADLPVSVCVKSYEEAREIKGLKANWDRIGENDAVRIVSIPDFDIIACSGTHVYRTSEIGGVHVEGFKGRYPEWEFRFTVHRNQKLKEESYAIRKLLREIGCPIEKLESVFKRLQQENKTLLKGIDSLREFVAFPWEEAAVKEFPLFFYHGANIPVEVASASVSRKIKEMDTSLCLFITSADEGSQFFLGAGERVSLDVAAFVRKNKILGIRGGGRKDWVSGRTQKDNLDLWVKELQLYFEA